MKTAHQGTTPDDELAREISKQIENFHTAELDIRRVFEGNKMVEQLFVARCEDNKEAPNKANAKLFKEEFMRRNVKLQNGTLNLQSMCLGINSMVILANCIGHKNIERLNLADNSLSAYIATNALKSIIRDPTLNLKYLNLASTQISGQGLELFLDDLIQNKTLKQLDLGGIEGSTKKNTLGVQGAVCISAMLIKNKVIESLSVNSNDLGPEGGECIGIALQDNDTLRQLKVADNDLRSEGANQIIKNSIHLSSLSLAKNFLKPDIGKPIAKLLRNTNTLTKLSLEFNQLSVVGAKWIAKGISQNRSLEYLNIKGNAIGDEGIALIAEVLQLTPKLRHFDCSLNEFGPIGFRTLCDVLADTKIQNLVCNKNYLGDDIMAIFANILACGNTTSLQQFDFSNCKLNDAGLILVINALHSNNQVHSIKLTDNFFSENVESVLLETLNRNSTLTEISLQGNRFSHSCLQKLKKIAVRNVKLIEDQEPNKLKAEIYRLKFENTKLEKAKKLLNQQQEEIQSVGQYKQNLRSHMESFKLQMKDKKLKIEGEIDQQQVQIKKKESQIKIKTEKIADIEEEFKLKIKELEEEYQHEKIIKQKIEDDFSEVKEELENIEERFTQKVGELREQIEGVKSETADYERKTKDLQKELNDYRNHKIY